MFLKLACAAIRRGDAVDAAGQESVGLRAATAERDPLRLQVSQTQARRLFLDQMLFLDHVSRQVQNARLTGDGEFVLLLGGDCTCKHE